MTVGSGPHRQRLTVVGLANSITGTASGWVAPAEIPLLRAAGGTSDYADALPLRSRRDRRAAPRRRGQAHGALPRGALAGSMSYYTAKIEENGNIAPFVPFLLAFGILGIVMSVLIVANVVGGAVVSGYRRIGILKSIGFTPLQVAAAYAAQVAAARPRRLSGRSRVRQLARDAAPPTERQRLRCRRTRCSHLGRSRGARRRSAPSLRSPLCCPRSERGGSAPIQAIATGRAPQSGRGYAAHRLFGRMPLPRPITIGLAAPFARPSRTLLTLAAVLLGATAVTFAVGLTSSLTRLLNGISHQQAEPVQIQMPGNGFDGGPKQAKPGTQHIKAGLPTRGQQVPAAKAEQAILAAVHSQPGTLHVVAQADESASVAGLSEQIPVTAFRGPAAWTGYDLVSGHWYAGPGQVARPDRLPHPDRNVSRRNDRPPRRPQADPCPNRRRDLRHRKPRPEPRHKLGHPPHDSIPASPPTSSTSASDPERRPALTRRLSTGGSGLTTTSNSTPARPPSSTP